MNNTKWNNQALDGWMEWKEVCAICKCSEPYKTILATEVTNAFKKKLRRVVNTELDNLFSFSDNNNVLSDNGEEEKMSVGDAEANESDSENNNIDFDAEGTGASLTQSKFYWANEFDCGIIEKANFSKKKKNYKDFVWSLFAKSSDPELKIIRGELLGFKGIINGIAERYLRYNHHSLWAKYRDSTDMVSWDKEFDDSEGNKITIGDTIGENDILTPTRSSRLGISDKDGLRNFFAEKFSQDNAAILLVYLTNFCSAFNGRKKISLGEPELLKFVGLSSSSCYDRLNKVILPVIKESKEMFIPGSVDFLFSLLKKQLQPEKEAEKLLLLLEE